MSDQCKYDGVPVGGMSVRSRRCENNAKLDGFCKTHHPDKIKSRRKKSEKRWEENHENMRTVRLVTLRKAEAGIAELEVNLQKCIESCGEWADENEALTAQLDAVKEIVVNMRRNTLVPRYCDLIDKALEAGE
jgi:hypothetical protein